MVTQTNTQLKMTEEEIEVYAKEFLKTAYNMELSVPVKINSRLTRAIGRYRYNANNGKPIQLDFSMNYILNGNLNDIQETIKHECIHLALHQLGKPFRDGTPLFESELKKHGSHSTGTINLKIERNVNIYKCTCQTHQTIRALRNNGRNHKCTKCNTNLTYMGKSTAIM